MPPLRLCQAVSAINQTREDGQKMTYTADLHTHSTASDGQYTPAQLADMAKKEGLAVWALTDHDTLDGL